MHTTVRVQILHRFLLHVIVYNQLSTPPIFLPAISSHVENGSKSVPVGLRIRLLKIPQSKSPANNEFAGLFDFYNRLLRCYALLELKIGRLVHQDIGHIADVGKLFYSENNINILKFNNRNNSIQEENKTVVEFTLPEDTKTLFAKEYKVYLRSKGQLKKQLV